MRVDEGGRISRIFRAARIELRLSAEWFVPCNGLKFRQTTNSPVTKSIANYQSDVGLS